MIRGCACTCSGNITHSNQNRWVVSVISLLIIVYPTAGYLKLPNSTRHLAISPSHGRMHTRVEFVNRDRIQNPSIAVSSASRHQTQSTVMAPISWPHHAGLCFWETTPSNIWPPDSDSRYRSLLRQYHCRNECNYYAHSNKINFWCASSHLKVFLPQKYSILSHGVVYCHVQQPSKWRFYKAKIYRSHGTCHVTTKSHEN